MLKKKKLKTYFNTQKVTLSTLRVYLVSTFSISISFLVFNFYEHLFKISLFSTLFSLFSRQVYTFKKELDNFVPKWILKHHFTTHLIYHFLFFISHSTLFNFFFHFTFSLILFVIVSLSSPIAIYLSSFSSLSLFTQIKLATTIKIKTNQPPPLRIHHHHHNHQFVPTINKPISNPQQTPSNPKSKTATYYHHHHHKSPLHQTNPPSQSTTL